MEAVLAWYLQGTCTWPRVRVTVERMCLSSQNSFNASHDSSQNSFIGTDGTTPNKHPAEGERPPLATHELCHERLPHLPRELGDGVLGGDAVRARVLHHVPHQVAPRRARHLSALPHLAARSLAFASSASSYGRAGSGGGRLP